MIYGIYYINLMEELWIIYRWIMMIYDHWWWFIDIYRSFMMMCGWSMDDLLMICGWYIYIYILMFISLSLSPPKLSVFFWWFSPSPHYQSLSFRDKQSLKHMQTTEHENNQHTNSSNFFYGERGPHGKGYSCSNCKTNWTGTYSKSTHFSSPPYPTCLGIRHLSLRHGHSPWKSTIDRSLLCLESLESWETNPPKIMGH